MFQDLRAALRRLHNRSALAITGTAIIAVGIAASTVTYSVVDPVLFRPPPYADPSGLLEVRDSPRTGTEQRASLPAETLTLWRAHPEVFRGVEAFRFRNVTLTGVGEAEYLPGAEVSSGITDLLGVAPQLGRAIQPHWVCGECFDDFRERFGWRVGV